MYRYWVDLGVLILDISSDIVLYNGMIDFRKGKPREEERKNVKVYVYSMEKYEMFPFGTETYREKMMQKGYYIGHHFGEPVKIKVMGIKEIHLCAKDYNRIFWSFIIKYILTIYCMENGKLHIKAGIVEKNNKAILLVGRGGSGKTELLRRLCKNGFKYCANTHAIIDGRKARGICTNIRVREQKDEYYLKPSEISKMGICSEWLQVDKILWIQYRTDEVVNIKDIKTNVMYENMRQFSEAIVNWELHEDIYDFYGSNLTLLANKLHENDLKLLTLINVTKNYFVNLDLYRSSSFDTLLNKL